MAFPNKAGDHTDTDDILHDELRAAGIPTWDEHDNILGDITHMKSIIRKLSGEVKSSTWGSLYGWEFNRAWYYWVAKGPGIEVEMAKTLNDQYGSVVRVNGVCGGACPIQMYKGLACGCYHIDTPEGLKALADTIKAQVAKYAHLIKSDDK